MSKLKDIIKRVYTKELEGTNKSVYDLFKWKKVTVQLVDYKTNKTIYKKENLEFPEFYSQNACDIIATKYFRKAGVPNGLGYETSLKEIVHRMVSFWVNEAKKEGLIKDKESTVLYDELAFGMINQMWSPNSPQYFNTGLKLIYDIDKPSEGHFYYDEDLKRVVPSKDAYTKTQGSACFIVSIEDKLLGDKSISEQIVTETRLFKYGSGVGTNFSTLRGLGEKLSGGGKSSGLISFLKVLDANAGAIKSGGTTRRSAKMVILNDNHPDLLEFIDWKSHEEQKVRDLGKMGYDIGFEGEAYQTVSGQNANNSVRFSNKFMDKLINSKDRNWLLEGVVDKNSNKEVSIDEIWNKFNKSSWECADPAPQFDDIINDWHTCPNGEDGNYNAKYNRINGSNPCSEYHFLDDTACNLASINLVKFYNEDNGVFDVEGYKHYVGLIQIVLESTIAGGQFPTEDIARKSYMFRTTGLGIANAGGLLMRMAIPYDSEEGRQLIASLVGILTGYSYFTSSLMAKEIGSFDKYEINKEHMLRVIKNHSIVAGAINEKPNLSYSPLMINHEIVKNISNDISNELKNSWILAYESGLKYGYRNAQVSVIAPTGTIALAMDSDTTSIEPFFSHIIYKKLSGGGFMKIVNNSLIIGLKKLGYSKEQIDSISKYLYDNERLEGCPYLKEEHFNVFDTATNHKDGFRYIKPRGHLNMLGQVTPLISGAISKTVNLPNLATVEDIKRVHEQAWKLGIKCVAIYRDGSKVSQPLNVSLEEKKKEDMTYKELLKYVESLENKLKNKVTDKEPTPTIVNNQEMVKVTCSSCGSEQLIPNGTCSICLVCGSTTGCS